MPSNIQQNLKKIFSKIRWRELLALLILFLAFVFFRSERKEMSAILPQLQHAKTLWIVLGILLTFIYISLQALMYISSFRAVDLKLNFWQAVELFLKRNFLSVFLPAGGVSSLAYTPRQLQRRNLNKNSIHKASAIFGFIGIFTVFLVGIPVVAYAAFLNKGVENSGYWLLGLGIFLAVILWMISAIKNKKGFYPILLKISPKSASSIENFTAGDINSKQLLLTVLYSTLIEFCGIFHLLIAMSAFGVEGSFSAAAIGYTLSVLLMLVSPFLRGLGAVEFSLIYILTNFGFSASESLGITLLYRIFEFWLPLLLGVFAFLWQGKKIAARILPVLAIFMLGIINIISVITPPLADRLHLGRNYLSEETIHFSKILTLVAGILLLVTAGALLRGLKRSWYFAVVLASISFFGNLFKALDYEEALAALLIIILLFYTRKEYVLKSNPHSSKKGISWALGIFLAVMVFNFLSFYLIDIRHFGINFTWQQSIYYTIHTFLLFQESDLIPKTGFAKDFQLINYFLGFTSWLVLIFSLLNVRRNSFSSHEISENEEAQNLVKIHGNSALDFFKTSEDKQLYFSETIEGFVSFRVANNFAVVLEEPVCAEEDKFLLINEFEKHCKTSGLRTVYYRIDEQSLALFQPLKKQKLFIGQEAILEVELFKLEGKDRKSLRNGLSSLAKKGYTAEVLNAPHGVETIEEISKISAEWLQEFDKQELVFSQGKFDAEEIKLQDLIIIKNNEAGIEAFLNIVPDFAPGECTYDLIRKTAAAPNGSMDAMIVKLVEYAKSKDFLFINLGLTPLGGLTAPDNTAEEILKFVYSRLPSFKHYQSLRSFKEKYATEWTNKYLLYGTDFDLLQIAPALNKINKPL